MLNQKHFNGGMLNICLKANPAYGDKPRQEFLFSQPRELVTHVTHIGRGRVPWKLCSKHRGQAEMLRGEPCPKTDHGL